MEISHNMVVIHDIHVHVYANFVWLELRLFFNFLSEL